MHATSCAYLELRVAEDLKGLKTCSKRIVVVCFAKCLATGEDDVASRWATEKLHI